MELEVIGYPDIVIDAKESMKIVYERIVDTFRDICWSHVTCGVCL